MMANIIFLEANESPFSYNRTIDYKSEGVRKNIEIGVRTELLYTTGADMVGVRLYLLMKHDGEQILNYCVTLAFNVEGWVEKYSKLAKEALLQAKEIEKMVEITVGFMRGSLFVQEKNTPLEGMNLPILTISELLPRIHVMKLSPKRQ